MLDDESMKKTIISTIEEMSQESGMVRIGDFYQLLKEKHNIDRVKAGKLIIELFKEGKVFSPSYHYIKTCED